MKRPLPVWVGEPDFGLGTVAPTSGWGTLTTQEKLRLIDPAVANYLRQSGAVPSFETKPAPEPTKPSFETLMKGGQLVAFGVAALILYTVFSRR